MLTKILSWFKPAELPVAQVTIVGHPATVSAAAPPDVSKSGMDRLTQRIGRLREALKDAADHKVPELQAELTAAEERVAALIAELQTLQATIVAPSVAEKPGKKGKK